MICDTSDVSTTAHNGRPVRATGESKTPERDGYELLAWAILEQAVDDLANLCRWGVVSGTGKCLPWPSTVKFKGGYYVRVLVTIASMRGPNDHRTLKAWLLSDEARGFCELIGCTLNPAEIFWTTVKNHGGLQ